MIKFFKNQIFFSIYVIISTSPVHFDVQRSLCVYCQVNEEILNYPEHLNTTPLISFQGKFPVHFKTSNIILHGKPVPLNPNHTHFVFVDDGFRNNYKGASEFRAMFEQKVSTPTQG